MSTFALSENASKPATGRVTYKVAGEAQRQAHARAIEADLTQRELRVLNAVIDFTTSFSKLSDDVYVEAIQEAAGLRGKGQYSRTCAILRKLDRLGIISYEGSTMRKEPSTVSLPALVGGLIPAYLTRVVRWAPPSLPNPKLGGPIRCSWVGSRRPTYLDRTEK